MTKRRIVVALILMAVLAALAVLLREHASLSELVRHEIRLRAAIRSAPITAWLLGLGLYFVVSLLPGTSGKSIVFGWLFGFWQGVLLVDFGLTLAALVTFLASRYLLHDLVRSRFRLALERLDHRLQRDGPFLLLLLRLMHTPFTFVNYGSGALGVRTGTFWWTTQLGLLPGTMIFVFAGSRLPTLSELVEHGPLELLDPWLLGALILTGVFPLIVHQVWQNRRAPNVKEHFVQENHSSQQKSSSSVTASGHVLDSTSDSALVHRRTGRRTHNGHNRPADGPAG